MMFNGYMAELGESIKLDDPKQYSSISKPGQIVTSFTSMVPVVGNIFGKVFGGLFKKATWMEGLTRDFLTSHLWDVGSKRLSRPGYYEKNYGVSTLSVDMVEHISTLWGGPGSVRDIDVNSLIKKALESASTRFKIAYDVLRNHSSIAGVINDVMGSRKWRYRYYLYRIANEHNAMSDLFKMSVAARHEARPETGVTVEQAEMVRSVWKQIMDQAAVEEYNETIGMIINAVEKALTSMVSNMEQIQEKGAVMKQAVSKAKEKGEVSPTKATFRYTKSGMPLVTLGGM